MSPRQDMNNREFLVAVMEDCLELARWAGFSKGPGVVVVDRRPEDSYLLTYVPIARYLQAATDQERQEILQGLAEMVAGQPEMGLFLLLFDRQGNKQLLWIIPPRSACSCPLLQ